MEGASQALLLARLQLFSPADPAASPEAAGIGARKLAVSLEALAGPLCSRERFMQITKSAYIVVNDGGSGLIVPLSPAASWPSSSSSENRPTRSDSSLMSLLCRTHLGV